VITQLGRHSTLPEDARGYEDLLLEVGNFTSIASGLTVVSGQHPPIANPECVSTFPFYEHGWGDYPQSGGPHRVTIGHDVWIGEGVTLLDGIAIGHGAIVGAHAVVAKDVQPYAVVVGNPARVIRWRFSEEVVEQLLAVQWWSWDDGRICERLPLLSDIKRLLP
jgi:acetyltransferase-like isoleucine patch superfamily enzyme